jgi:hypothetical protein
MKAPSPQEQLVIQAIHALRLWQQVTVSDSRQATALDVAKLALELARLRGKSDPTVFLDEAARLLTEAKFALGREQARPEREAMEQSKQAHEKLVKLIEPSCTWSWQDGSEWKREVPFNLLYKPGKTEGGEASKYPPVKFVMQNGETPPVTKEFLWQPFTSKRGFRNLLEHGVKLDDPQLAHTENVHLAKILRDTVNRVWETLEAGKFSIDSVFDLHQLRKRLDSEKSRKAMASRLGKIKTVEAKQTKAVTRRQKKASV